MNLLTGFKMIKFITDNSVKSDGLYLKGSQEYFAKEVNIPIATFKRYFKVLRQNGLVERKSSQVYIVSQKTFDYLNFKNLETLIPKTKRRTKKNVIQ